MEIKFKLLSTTEKMIHYINRQLINYPKKEIVLKHSIEKNQYELLECIFAFNINQTARVKEKYLKDYLVKLSMFDFFVRESYHKKYLSKKQMESVTKLVVDARKITYGLIRSDNTKNE